VTMLPDGLSEACSPMSPLSRLGFAVALSALPSVAWSQAAPAVRDSAGITIVTYATRPEGRLVVLDTTLRRSSRRCSGPI